MLCQKKKQRRNQPAVAADSLVKNMTGKHSADFPPLTISLLFSYNPRLLLTSCLTLAS